MIYVAIIALLLTLSKTRGEVKKDSVYNHIPKWNTYTPEGWEPANKYRVT